MISYAFPKQMPPMQVSYWDKAILGQAAFKSLASKFSGSNTVF
jgi:hypothetical protein